MKNTIPPMTDPDGRNWLQPSTDNILIDDTHALMTRSDYNQLIDYSHSVLSGVYPGKIWKTTAQGGRQFLWWFGELLGHDDLCTNNRREILIVDEQINSGIQLEVLWMGKSDVFVSFVKGPAPLSELQDIETQLLNDADEYEMFAEHGTYQISVTRDHGEFDSCGRCEIAPYWDFDIQQFEPMPEE